MIVPESSAATDRPAVVVVGGGLSGIAAALDCARSGASVRLVESKGRLGGAAYSFDRHGIYADNGQHVFLRCCTAYRQLLADLDAGAMVTLQPRLDIPVLAPGGRRARLYRDALPAPLHLAASLARYSLLRPGERLSLVRAMRALGRIDPDDPEIDARSFGDWLAEQGQSTRAVEAIWELICRPTLNLRVEDASLAQAAQVFQVGLLGDPAAGDVGHATVPLSDIHDRAACQALQAAGVEVMLRTGAAHVAAGSEGFRVELSRGRALAADAVILATQPQRTARLLPPEAGISTAALKSLGSSPIVNLHVVFERPVLDVPFAAGVYTPVQWIFDRTRSAGVAEGQYLAVTLSAADDELATPAEDLQARYLPALRELLPAARGVPVRQFFVTREHAATFRAGPGARANRPGTATRLPGLFLAGTWTDTGWPATMESAVRSGRAACVEALAWLGQRAVRTEQRVKETV